MCLKLQQTTEKQDFIESVFERFEGVCSPPNVCAACAKLDKASTGYLDRPRFALALRGLRPSLELPPPLLRAAIDYFDDTDTSEVGRKSPRGSAEGESGRIDYR